MSIRFQRRIKILPGVKLNISKKGISTTIGPRGLSVNTGKRGTYLNTGIPGSGISSRTKLSGNNNHLSSTSYQTQANMEIFKRSQKEVSSKILCWLTFFILIITSALTKNMFNDDAITGVIYIVIILIAIIYRYNSKKHKAKALINTAISHYNMGAFGLALEKLQEAYSICPAQGIKDDIDALSYILSQNEVEDSDHSKSSS